MSKLLEILGRAMTIDTADLIWHWLDVVKSSGADTESPQTQQLAGIIDLVGQRKTDTAEENLRLYLFDNPSCVRGRLAAAAMCLSKNHLQHAIEQLNSVYMRQPSNTMALYALGHCYERLGKESEAIEFYQDCLKFKNYLQPPRQRLAAIHFKNGRLEDTIQEYELLRSEYPDDISTLITLGHLYIACTEHDKAVETFNTAILIHPDNFLAQDDRIDRLIRDGQLYEALEQIELLLEQQPGRTDLPLKRADVLAALGAGEQAVAQYLELLRLCPDFLEATIKLGTQYLQMQEGQLAAQQFNRAAEINDQIVDAYIGLAMAQKLAARNPEAFVTLSLASAIQQNSSLLIAETAALQLKSHLEQSSKLDNADSPEDLVAAVIKSHQQQIRQRPQNPELQYRLGLLLTSIGKMTHAATAFQHALRINPTFARARSKLAVCLFETDQKQLAIEQLSAPDCLDSDTLQLHYKTALLYCDKIRFASSLMNLERSMENNFTSSDAAVNISIVLQNLGLLDRAAAMWDNLSDTTHHALNSNHPFGQNDF